MDEMEKYFNDLKKVILLQAELTEHPCEIDDNDEWLIAILKQIFLAGRRKQGEVDAEAVSELLVRADVDGDVIEHNMAINEALCALKSVQPKGQ